jgi:hypothetical protein
MNLRVRRVTGESESAIFAVWMASLSCEVDDQDRRLCWLVVFFAVGDFWRAARNWVEQSKIPVPCRVIGCEP